MTERDPDNLIILQYLLPCIQRPSIVCTHSKTVKLVQRLKSIQLMNCCLDCYLVNLTKPTEMSLLTIMWKNMCGLHCWHTFFLMQTSKRAVCTEGSWHSNDRLWSSDHWNAEVHYTRMQHGCFFIVERLRRQAANWRSPWLAVNSNTNSRCETSPRSTSPYPAFSVFRAKGRRGVSCDGGKMGVRRHLALRRHTYFSQ